MRQTCQSEVALLTRFSFKEEKRQEREICVFANGPCACCMSASWTDGFQLSHAIALLCAHTMSVVLFWAKIASANCTASWTVSTEWHPCWRLTCFVHMFLWDAVRDTDFGRVCGMCWACTLRTGGSQLTCLIWHLVATAGLDTPDPQVCSLHVWRDGRQNFSPFTSVFLFLLEAIKVWTCFFFLIFFHTALTS